MSNQWHGGKGSLPRPYSVSQEQYSSNWDAIFSKKKKAETVESSEAGQEKKPCGNCDKCKCQKT